MSFYLVTGATGQIGSRLLQSLLQKGVPVRTLGRKPLPGPEHVLADLEWATAAELQSGCRDVDVLCHCAGYAHTYPAINDKDSDADKHHRINLEATQRLAEAAAVAGVKKFIFLSSVKALGEPGSACADEAWAGLPQSAYGKAKRAAEKVLLEIASRTGMQVVNLRLAMVYGGCNSNMERMITMICRGLFPPLPETGNKRSIVYIDDVIGAIHRVVDETRAAGRTYIVADKQPYSGRQIYDAIRQAFGMKPMPFFVPNMLLQLAAKMGDGLEFLTDKRMPLDSEVLDKLLGSACYDPSCIERELGWRANYTLQQGLAKMAGDTKLCSK